MNKYFSIIFVLLFMYAQVGGQEKVTPTFKYEGVKKCKFCHKGERSGKQFELWQASKHAHAYLTLAGASAQKVAAERGLKENPQTAKECVVCHVTGFHATAEQQGIALTLEEGVSCESCHGPGSEYKSNSIMKGIFSGELKGEDYGLIQPNEALCIRCHNKNSPFYKKFIYEEEVKKVLHPVPAKTGEVKE